MTQVELKLNSQQQQQGQGEKVRVAQILAEFANRTDEISLCGLAQQEPDQKRQRQ